MKQQYVLRRLHKSDSPVLSFVFLNKTFSPQRAEVAHDTLFKRQAGIAPRQHP